MFTSEMLKEVESLLSPGMGTEHVAGLLYSLVRMTRPRTVMEVGLGYTTPFLLNALDDNVKEIKDDIELLKKQPGDPGTSKRRGLLLEEYYLNNYDPKLIAIDDYSAAGSTAPKVLDVIDRLGLRSYIDLYESDFRNLAGKLDAADLPLDFVWFDCGGPQDYIDFFREYWEYVNPNHGLVVLHFSYWQLETTEETANGTLVKQNSMFPGSILNELKRQQAALGAKASFEVLSLLEPHKFRQGSITLLRRLPAQSMCREVDFRDELSSIIGRTVDHGFAIE